MFLSLDGGETPMTPLSPDHYLTEERFERWAEKLENKLDAVIAKNQDLALLVEQRVVVLEVQQRHTGWFAAWVAGIIAAVVAAIVTGLLFAMIRALEGQTL